MLKRWAAYYVALLATLAFALWVPGRVSSAFFYTLLALPVVSVLAALWMMKGFRYEQSLERTEALKGDTVIYRLTVRNHCPLMFPHLEAVFRNAGPAQGSGPLQAAFPVPPFGESTWETRIACVCRGAYEVGLQQVRLYDYLGLFLFRQNVAAIGVLTVYPRILPADGFPLEAGLSPEHSKHAARSQENTENISDLRKYANGDRLRSIHWKLSAKRDELMVKNYEQVSGASAELVVDASGCGSDPAAEDRLAECAVSIAWHCAARSAPLTVWLCNQAPVKHTVHTAKEFHAVYRLLSEVAFGAEQTLPGAALLAQGGADGRRTVAIAAVTLSEPACALALKARASGCTAVMVLASEGADLEDGRLMALLHAGVLLLRMGKGGGLRALHAEEASDAV